jgi:hypothetical protein
MDRRDSSLDVQTDEERVRVRGEPDGYGRMGWGSEASTSCTDVERQKRWDVSVAGVLQCMTMS